MDAVERLSPPDWGLGATVPSFVVAFALASAVAFATTRREAASAAASASASHGPARRRRQHLAGRRRRRAPARRWRASCGAGAHCATWSGREHDRRAVRPGRRGRGSCPTVEELGVPLTVVPARTTPAFAFDYRGGERRMTVEADPRGRGRSGGSLGSAERTPPRVHLGAVFRGRVPARGRWRQLAGAERLVSLDGQGLVRSRPARARSSCVAHDDLAQALEGVENMVESWRWRKDGGAAGLRDARGGSRGSTFRRVIKAWPAGARGAAVWADGRLSSSSRGRARLGGGADGSRRTTRSPSATWRPGWTAPLRSRLPEAAEPWWWRYSTRRKTGVRSPGVSYRVKRDEPDTLPSHTAGCGPSRRAGFRGRHARSIEHIRRRTLS